MLQACDQIAAALDVEACHGDDDASAERRTSLQIKPCCICTVFVHWKKYRSAARWHKSKPPAMRIKATLLHPFYNINGEKRQKYISHLASYRPSTRDDIATRCLFWISARQRLDRIDLTPQQRRKIERELAARVRRPTAKQMARCAV
jgi:hypothetical protein